MKVFQALLYCSHSPRFFHSSLFIRDAILCCDVIWRKSVRKISKFTQKFILCILSWVQYLSTLSEIKLSFTFQFFCLSVLLSFCMFSLFSWEQGNGFWKSISYRLLQYCLEIYFRNVHYSSHWVEVLVSTTFHFRINQTDAAYLRTQRYLNFWSWSWLVQAIFHPRIDKVVIWKKIYGKKSMEWTWVPPYRQCPKLPYGQIRTTSLNV